MMQGNAFELLDALFVTAGDNDYIGESVSQAEHALQCAALAANASDDAEVIAAALLHDVGHFCSKAAESLEGHGAVQHEIVGGDYLFALGFSARVADLVESHVAAKRYLVATRPAYFEKLSPASVHTLTLQGGAMSETQCREFEQRADFELALKLRAWDEAAKVRDKSVPGFEHYRSLIESCTKPAQLTSDQQSAFHEQGYLLIPSPFSDRQQKRLMVWVDEMQDLADTPGKWMKYYEGTGLLCRIENFAQYHEGLGNLIAGPRSIDLVTQLMDEPAVLFKEKINFKLAGGAGFEAHQDAPAFTTFGHKYHITMMLGFDAATPANGCLEIARGKYGRDLLDMTESLTLLPEIESRLTWEPLPTKPGDILLFDSYVPHRSAANSTASSRRAIYATYNRRVDGDVRDAYFAEKRKVFPPECEKVPGQVYSDTGVFNVGNPVK